MSCVIICVAVIILMTPYMLYNANALSSISSVVENNSIRISKDDAKHNQILWQEYEMMGRKDKAVTINNSGHGECITMPGMESLVTYKYLNEKRNEMKSGKRNGIEPRHKMPDSNKTNVPETIEYLNKVNVKHDAFSRRSRRRPRRIQEEQVQEQEQEQNNIINMLQQQFVYQFAMKYKFISHVTLFTCRRQGLLPFRGNNDKWMHFRESIPSVTYEEMMFFKYLYNPSGTMKNHKYSQSTINPTETEQKRQEQQERRQEEHEHGSSLMLKIVPIDHLQEEPSQQQQETEKKDLKVSKKSLFNGRIHWLLLERDKSFIVKGHTSSDRDLPISLNTKKKSGPEKDWNASSNTLQTAQPSQNSSKKKQVNATVALDDASKLKSYTQDAENDSTESVEKFLEKLNININAELILAKLCNAPQSLHTAQTSTKTASYVQENQYNEISGYNTESAPDYVYNLYDIWNPGLHYGGKLNISLMGNFTLQKGLQFHEVYRFESAVKRRMNMKLARIRCMIVLIHKNRSDTIDHYLTSPYNTHMDSMHRFNYALILLVRDMFNFSIALSKVSSWGYLKNGKFDGMIGALTRNRTDIAGSPAFFRLERAKVIDYTIGTWTARPCFIFRHPRSTKKDRVVFLQPFTEDVWLYVGLLASATIISLWILTTLERKMEYPITGSNGTTAMKNVNVAVELLGSDNRNANKNKGQRRQGLKCIQWFKQQSLLRCPGRSRRYPFADASEMVNQPTAKQRRLNTFLEAFLFYIGSICQQGLSYSTSSVSGRCIVITSILFSFTIYQFYLASIVGTLLMEKPKTIRTLTDLIQSSLDLGIEDIPYTRDFFLKSKDPVIQELYAKKVTHKSVSPATNNSPGNGPTMTPITVNKTKGYRDIVHSHESGAHAKSNEASNWYEPEYGVRKVKEGQFAFHVDVATAYKIISDTFNEKETCDLSEIEMIPTQKMMGFVQKHSPLREMMTYGLSRVMEAGLVDYQRQKWHSRKPRCVKQLHTEDLQVDLQTFTSALLLFTYGSILSLMILLIEILHHKRDQQHRDNERHQPAMKISTVY